MTTAIVNGAALNRSALAYWVKPATVAVSARATAACSAILVHKGAAQLSGTGSGAIRGIRIKTAQVVSPAAVAPDYLSARLVAAGAAALSGTCIAVARSPRNMQATAVLAGGCTGYAIPGSHLGEVSGTLSGAMGNVAAGRVRPGRSSLIGTILQEPIYTRYNCQLTLTATCRARVEASVGLSGEDFFRHDGFVDGTLGATATIDSGYLVRSVALHGSTSMTCTGSRKRPARASLAAVSIQGAIAYKGNISGEVQVLTSSISCTASAMRVRTAGATAGVGRATVHYFFPAVGHSARVAGGAACSVSAFGHIYHAGASAVAGQASNFTATAGRIKSAQATGSGEGSFTVICLARSNPSHVFLVGTALLSADARVLYTYLAQADVSASALLAASAAHAHAALCAETLRCEIAVAPSCARGGRVTALATALLEARATARGDLNAPPERSMLVPYTPRSLTVPSEDRTMRIPV